MNDAVLSTINLYPDHELWGIKDSIMLLLLLFFKYDVME